jgi:hypothetical protein
MHASMDGDVAKKHTIITQQYDILHALHGIYLVLLVRVFLLDPAVIGFL